MRLYKLLLHLYPASFRTEYGSELVRIFRMNASFEAMSAYALFAWNFTGEGNPQRLAGAAVTPEFFKILSVKPLVG